MRLKGIGDGQEGIDWERTTDIETVTDELKNTNRYLIIDGTEGLKWLN